MEKFDNSPNTHTIMQSGEKDFALVVSKEEKLITLKLKKADQYVTIDYSNEILFGDGWNDYIDSFEEGEVIAVRILKIRRGEITVLPELMYDTFDFEGAEKITYSIQEQVDILEKEISEKNKKVQKLKNVRKNLISNIEYIAGKILAEEVSDIEATERKQRNRELNLAKVEEILKDLSEEADKLEQTLWHAKNNLKKFRRRYRNAEKRLYPYQETKQAA